MVLLFLTFRSLEPDSLALGKVASLPRHRADGGAALRAQEGAMKMLGKHWTPSMERLTNFSLPLSPFPFFSLLMLKTAVIWI